MDGEVPYAAGPGGQVPLKTGTADGSEVSMKEGPGVKDQPLPNACYYHKELPAAFVCNRCGKHICSSCAIRYGHMVSCPQCTPYPTGMPYGYSYPYPYPARPIGPNPTNVVYTGGLLLVMAGILGFVYTVAAIMLPVSGFTPLLPAPDGNVFVCIILPLISSIIAMVGGIYAYHKTNFPTAVCGSIFSLFTWGFLVGSIIGLIGMIFIIVGRYEFSDVKFVPPAQTGYNPYQYRY